MRRRIFLLACVLALASCQKPLFDALPRWRLEHARTRQPLQTPQEPVDSARVEIPLSRGVYLTAVRFPDWADWRSGDFRGAQAVLYKDSVEIRAVPAGPQPSSDRLRLVGGHLWTDTADAGQTVICCDGEERIRYDSEELLRGFLFVDGAVHTLGQRPGGAGFSYRVDGEERFTSPTGQILGSPENPEWPGGAFSRDSTGIYFVYALPIRQASAHTYEYHVMRGGREVKEIPARTAGAVYDIRVFDGSIYRCERRNESSQSFCLVKDDLYLALDIRADELVKGCSLVPIRGKIMLKGHSESAVGNEQYWYRTQDGFWYALSRNDVRQMYEDNGVVSYVCCSPGGLVSALMKDHRPLPVTPETYRLTDGRCAQFREGVFAVALTHASGNAHLVLVDGKAIPFNFNGYFTSLTIL